MGVLYARVAGAWVPISSSGGLTPPPGSAYITDPAQAGPRSDGPTVARFGNVSADNRAGFSALNESSLQTVTGNGKVLALYQLNAGGTGYEQLGQFGYLSSFMNGWAFGGHPAHGAVYTSLWPYGYAGASDYTIMANPGAGQTFVSGRSALFLRVANVDGIALSPGSMLLTGKVSTDYNTPNGDWNMATIVAQAAGGFGCRISMWNSYAPQFRVMAATGERIAAVTANVSNWCPLAASAFEVSSSQTLKRDIRSLRPERERIVVRHEPLVDTVPAPDIMALRPVAFRPDSEPPRRYLNKGDADTWEHDPPGSSFGVQARRERLGLIAEDVQHVIPSAVSHDVDGVPMGIDYAQITVALLDHVQALTDEVATLRYRITELEAR